MGKSLKTMVGLLAYSGGVGEGYAVILECENEFSNQKLLTNFQLG